MCNVRKRFILPYIVSIRYIRNHAGLFEVTSLWNGCTIVVFPATMRRVLGIDPRASVGYAEIDPEQAKQLGFIPVEKMQEVTADDYTCEPVAHAF